MSGVVYDKNGTSFSSAYSKDGTSLQSVFAIDGTEIEFSEPPVEFLDTAIVSALPSISVSGIKQGACTDGTYIYQIVFDTSAYNSGKFIKYRISDGTYTTVSFSTRDYGHGNDMCYNPNNQHIYVACMTDDGAIRELDTDFNFIASHTLLKGDGTPETVWQFCFDRKTNRFLSAQSGYFQIYDQSFNYLGQFLMTPHPDATGQGCETDGDFIYRITYNPNYINVATVDGTFVKTMNLPGGGEPETIMYNWETGEYYISRNVTSNFFSKVQLKE